MSATDALPVAGAGDGGEAGLLASLNGVAVAGSVVVPGSPSVLTGVDDLVPELTPAPAPAVNEYALEVPVDNSSVAAAPEPAPAPVAPGFIEVRLAGVTPGYTAAAHLTTADGLTTVTSLPVVGPDWTVTFSDLADGIYKVVVQLDSPSVPPDGAGIDIGSASTLVQSDFNVGVAAGTATTVYFDAATQTFTAVQ